MAASALGQKRNNNPSTPLHKHDRRRLFCSSGLTALSASASNAKLRLFLTFDCDPALASSRRPECGQIQAGPERSGRDRMAGLIACGFRGAGLNFVMESVEDVRWHRQIRGRRRRSFFDEPFFD
jgi:hypothetical protein